MKVIKTFSNKKERAVKIRVSPEFKKMLDIERNLEPKQMSRVLFTEKKAAELKEKIFGKKKGGIMDDFKF